MSARELRAEARAWRRAAERLDACPWVCLREAASQAGRWRCPTCGGETQTAASAMANRLAEHWSAADNDGLGYWLERENGSHVPNPLVLDFDHRDRVLACLFLALECEDEARALGRGKTPDRRSGR